MAGAFNQNLLKFLRATAGDDPSAKFYVIGQTGYRALLHKDPRLVEEFQYGATAPTLQRARDITVDAIEDFKAGNLDEIYLIYTKIQNALTSEPVLVRLLPLDREPICSPPRRVWATRAARWRCSRTPGRSLSRPRPSICTA